MIRNAAGSLLALIGAAAAVRSPFRPWYDGRHGRDFRIGQLFDDKGVTGDGAHLLNGLFLPMFVAVVVTLLGLLNQSRPLIFVAGVLVLGFTILWMVRQTQAEGSLTAGGDGLDVGVGLGFAAGALMLTGAQVMRGPRGRKGHRRRQARSAMARRAMAGGYRRRTPVGAYDDAPCADAPYAPYAYEPYAAEPYGQQAYGSWPYEHQSYANQQYATQQYATQQYWHQPYEQVPYEQVPNEQVSYAPWTDATIHPFPEPPREAPFQAHWPTPHEEDWRNAA